MTSNFNLETLHPVLTIDNDVLPIIFVTVIVTTTIFYLTPLVVYYFCPQKDVLGETVHKCKTDISYLSEKVDVVDCYQNNAINALNDRVISFNLDQNSVANSLSKKIDLLNSDQKEMEDGLKTLTEVVTDTTFSSIKDLNKKISLLKDDVNNTASFNSVNELSTELEELSEKVIIENQRIFDLNKMFLEFKEEVNSALSLLTSSVEQLNFLFQTESLSIYNNIAEQTSSISASDMSVIAANLGVESLVGIVGVAAIAGIVDIATLNISGDNIEINLPVEDSAVLENKTEGEL